MKKSLKDIAKRIGYIFEPSNKVEMKSLSNEFERIKENLKIEHKKCLVEFVQFIFNKYPSLKTFDLNFTASFGEDGMHSNWSGGEVMEITLALDLITEKDIDAVLERTIEQLNDEFNKLYKTSLNCIEIMELTDNICDYSDFPEVNLVFAKEANGEFMEVTVE